MVVLDHDVQQDKVDIRCVCSQNPFLESGNKKNKLNT